MYKIHTVPECPKLFQAEEDVGINVAGKLEVKTKDKTFSPSIFPFLHSDFLAEQLLARQNYEGPSNLTFTYDQFSYKVVKLFFDQLSLVKADEVSLPDVLELMVFSNHEGQIDQGSEFETRLYKDLLQQILTKIEDPKQHCFIWMHLRSLGPSACHSLANSLIKLVNEDDYNYAVSKIIVGPEKLRDECLKEEIFELVQKIHEKLEDSPTEIMPFIQSCTREILADKWILEWDKSTAYNASVDGGTFIKPVGNGGFARAMEVMNSKFPNDFRWSIRLTDNYTCIYIGIASKLQRERTFVGDYDEYAIIYFPGTGKIKKKGQESDFIKVEGGGEIHFRCQPKQKKFSLAINDSATEFDMEENVNYFPVIGAVPAWTSSATLFKPQLDWWHTPNMVWAQQRQNY